MSYGITFATSPYAKTLVLTAVGFFVAAILVAMWTVERWVKARRSSRARDLWLQRARRRGLAPVGAGLPAPAAARQRVAYGAQRARAAGVDELLIDDLALWSGRLQ